MLRVGKEAISLAYPQMQMQSILYVHVLLKQNFNLDNQKRLRCVRIEALCSFA